MIGNAARTKRYFEFDEFRIDLSERRLECDCLPVALTPKVFDILLVLVENHGRTITKEALLGQVWGEAFVEEGNLSRGVSTLRRALGEDAHGQRFIKTVPKRGYRFEGDVREIFEEDESITVERRTDYRLALSETTETRSETRFSPATLAGIAASVILVVVIALVWQQRTTSNAVATAAPETDERSAARTEAFEIYTKARELWQNRSVTGLHQATVDLERVVRLDPEFARGQAALADAYASMSLNGRTPWLSPARRSGSTLRSASRMRRSDL